MALNARQRRFVDEYLIDLNATQAAIRAGYSQKTAYSVGHENLRKPEIAQALAEAQKARAARTGVTQDRVLAELAKLGFSDIRNVMNWGEAIAVKDAESGESRIVHGVALVPAADLTDDAAASISEIAETANGIRIKMHDKRAALVDIGKHLGMFKESLEINGSMEHSLAASLDRLKKLDGDTGS